MASARAFDSAAATVPAGAGGLIYLPYLEGERSPVFDAQAQGVFFGMNTTHKREHFLRAVLEGTACGLSQILDVMRERQEIHDLRIIGGGAKSKLWKQILADVCNVTFHDVSTFSDSATSLGAAAAAGVAIRAVPGSAGGLQPYPHERRHRAGPCRAARSTRSSKSATPCSTPASKRRSTPEHK